MDPVSGIGLASSIIQIVTFGVQLASAGKNVYRQGSVSQYDDLDYTTNHLSGLTQSLQKALQSPGGQSMALNEAEQNLMNLGHKSEHCAQELLNELRKLQPQQPDSSKLEAAQIAFRAFRKSRHIRRVAESLSSFQATLEFSLLYDLRCVASL